MVGMPQRNDPREGRRLLASIDRSPLLGSQGPSVPYPVADPGSSRPTQCHPGSRIPQMGSDRLRTSPEGGSTVHHLGPKRIRPSVPIPREDLGSRSRAHQELNGVFPHALRGICLGERLRTAYGPFERPVSRPLENEARSSPDPSGEPAAGSLSAVIESPGQAAPSQPVGGPNRGRSLFGGVGRILAAAAKHELWVGRRFSGRSR